jgi:hypothetical protein
MPFAAKITAAAKGQAADFTAEEQDALKTVATAATKIISQSQDFTAEELTNNANVLANAKGLQKVAESMGAMVVANGDSLKMVKHIQTYDDAKTYFDNVYSPRKQTLKATFANFFDAGLQNQDFTALLNLLIADCDEIITRLGEDVDEPSVKLRGTINNEKEFYTTLIDIITNNRTSILVNTATVEADLMAYKTQIANNAQVTSLTNLEAQYKLFIRLFAPLFQQKYDAVSNIFVKALCSQAIKKQKYFSDLSTFVNAYQAQPLSETMQRTVSDAYTTISNTMVDIPNTADGKNRRTELQNFDIELTKALASGVEIRREVLPDGGKNGGTLSMDIKTGEFIIATVANAPASFLIHELQHLIQYSKGQMAFATAKNSEGDPHPWLYDVTDEIEAYKVQYSVAPNSMPLKRDGTKINSIAEITADYVNIDLGYNLPTVSLTMDSKLSEIEAALISIGKNKRPSWVDIAIYEMYADRKLRDVLVSIPSIIENAQIKFK